MTAPARRMSQGGGETGRSEKIFTTETRRHGGHTEELLLFGAPTDSLPVAAETLWLARANDQEWLRDPSVPPCLRGSNSRLA